MGDWARFLQTSDAEIRRNENNRGMSYTPDPAGTTVDLVAEYVAGFAWRGCGAREITGAVQRDERGVKRALASLVEDGRVRVEETITRGPKASKRKTYFQIESRGPMTVSLPDGPDGDSGIELLPE